MAITMTANKGGNTDTNRFEADPGAYEFKLVEITIDQGSDYDDKSITFPQARLKWEDADGDSFSDSFVKIPIGFSLNDKAKWTNRLSALVGRPLTDEDAESGRLKMDLGPDIGSYDDLCQYVDQVGDNGRKQFLKVLALTCDGESLFGRRAVLTLGKNGKGYMTCAANGAAPMPSTAGKKKKQAEVAPAAAGAPTAEDAPF